MTSVFSPNKHIEEPASGDYNDAWAAPINANWTLLDTALGGHTNIVVTGVTGPIIALTLSQYQPPNIIFAGVLSANLTYTIPSGVGGIWTIYNATSGSFTLQVIVAGGTGNTLKQNTRNIVVSDGSNFSLAQTVPVSFADLTGQVSNAQVPQSAVTQYQAALAIAFTQLTGIAALGQIPSLPASQITSGTFANARISQASVTQFQAALAIAFTQLTGSATLAQIPSLPASQITSGTFPNARLPNVAAGPGVTIAADPGTTPSGVFGDIFFYY